jgi:hypothetical protein
MCRKSRNATSHNLQPHPQALTPSLDIEDGLVPVVVNSRSDLSASRLRRTPLRVRLRDGGRSEPSVAFPTHHAGGGET